MNPIRLLVMVTLGLVGSAVMLGAEKIPSLLQVSPLLPASEQQSLLEQREKIQERWRDFKEASDRFNQKPAELQTDKEFDRLTEERALYIEAVNQFNTVITARMAVLESGNTRVVDARDVPSGLPPAMDRAIAGAYAAAPPGVADRVRKGFQGVMDHDWKVAQAWFEDALNLDPANAGLKRLVALAASSTAIKSPARASPAVKNLQVPDKNDAMLLFDPDGWGLIHPTGTAADKMVPSAGTDAADDSLLINDPFSWRRKHPDWWKDIPKEPNVTTTLPDGTLQVQLPHPRLLETDPESWTKLHPDWWRDIPEKAVVTTIAPDGKAIILPHPSETGYLFVTPAASAGSKPQAKDGPPLHN